MIVANLGEEIVFWGQLAVLLLILAAALIEMGPAIAEALRHLLRGALLAVGLILGVVLWLPVLLVCMAARAVGAAWSWWWTLWLRFWCAVRICWVLGRPWSVAWRRSGREGSHGI
ncbi:hypothetical protein [Accumulibacter sp.]|uniref:hypothetical protein n=1 Tax=Accumulibacter sp. TaxID=2053492 RepID=UPI001AC31AD0|nr:hypothetical protein [Accumulibacter sp.]MBN8452243.1 hypothetical protein [Accumulibacter sp.]